MSICRNLLAVTAAIAVLGPGASYAIDPHRAMSQYVRDRWGADQGFPGGSVYQIAQTKDGYLWFATERGLVRFDGLEFRLIEDHTGFFRFGTVLGVTADRQGDLWLRLPGTSLLRYRNGRFEYPFRSAGSFSNITAMTKGTDGGMLAGWLQNGAFGYRDGVLKVVARASGIPRSPVIAMAQMPDGDVWLGTRGAGLYRLSHGKTFAMSQGLPDRKVNCLLPDGEKGLWIGTDHGLARWNGSEITVPGREGSPDRFQILALANDHDANLWVGTDSGGVMRVKDGVVSPLDPGIDGMGSAVTSLLEDREGSLWIGSSNGVERLRDSPFVTYSVPEGLPTDGSNPVLVDSRNRMWFAPVAGGLWWFGDGRHGSVAALDGKVVYSIAGDADELWTGGRSGGLTRIRDRQGIVSTKTYTRADGLAQDSVYSVYRDRAGAVWAGTLSGGVSKLDKGVFTTYSITNGLASNTVASILETTDGTMWFATPGGLSSLGTNAKWKTYSIADHLPSENVNCLMEDSAGVLWAGTAAGLAFRSAGAFEVPAHAPAALKEQVLGLAEDKFGSIWIATSHHVLRVNRSKLLNGMATAADVSAFGPADGLRGEEGVKRHRSVVSDSLGRIWISLNKGISVVDPGRLRAGMAEALPHIQSISANGNKIEPADAVKIPAGRQRIVFGYSGLSLALPERVRFRYWLENFDRGWSEPVESREAAYTNVGPGSYRFHVMATNPAGAWSAKEATLAFEVAPSFWQTWWFRALVALTILTATIEIYRMRLRQLTARLNVRFEERLGERTRIAQELHDTLLQGFLSASMQIHVATNRLPPDSPAKPAMTRALELMRQVIDEGRNAVRGLRSTKSTSMDLEESFSRIEEEALHDDAAGKRAAFRVITEGERMPLHPVLRDEVYRIGREALINAFRHAKARNIEVEMNYSSSAFRVVVRDDGCGIDNHTLNAGRDGHWGLSGMRERAERIGARLRVWSNPGAGTEVELTVPGHIAFHRGQRVLAKDVR